MPLPCGSSTAQLPIRLLMISTADSAPPPPCLLGGKEVVVSRKCGEAVLRGAPIYVPGVLACSPGVERGDLVAVSVVLERPGRWGMRRDRGLWP